MSDVYYRSCLTPHPKIKLILVGDVHTGKTSIVCSLRGEEFVRDYFQTLGIDFNAHTVSIKSVYKNRRITHTVDLHLWDISGNRKFRDITSVYYTGINGAIIVFDITSRESYENVPYWLKELSSTQIESYHTLLIGNKSDLSNRAVSTLEAVNFANENRLLYSETSAKTDSGISAAFEILARTVVSGKSCTLFRDQIDKKKCVLL